MVWTANNFNICHITVLGRLLILTVLVPRPSQPYILPGVANDDQLRLERQSCSAKKWLHVCKYSPLLSCVLCYIMCLIVISVCTIVKLRHWVSLAPLFGSVYITVLNCVCYVMFIWWFVLHYICTVLRGRYCVIKHSYCNTNKMYTVCPGNSKQMYTFSSLRQTMSDFNQILHQQCKVYLQTNHRISTKSVNVCKSYSKFSEVAQKHIVSTIGDVKVQKSNLFKVCVQNILHVLECKLEDVNWAEMACFINEQWIM